MACDAEHGWCRCGQWHENPGKEKRRLGYRDTGLLVYNFETGVLSRIKPEDVPAFMTREVKRGGS